MSGSRFCGWGSRGCFLPQTRMCVCGDCPDRLYDYVDVIMHSYTTSGAPVAPPPPVPRHLCGLGRQQGHTPTHTHTPARGRLSNFRCRTQNHYGILSHVRADVLRCSRSRMRVIYARSCVEYNRRRAICPSDRVDGDDDGDVGAVAQRRRHTMPSRFKVKRAITRAYYSSKCAAYATARAHTSE